MDFKTPQRALLVMLILFIAITPTMAASKSSKLRNSKPVNTEKSNKGTEIKNNEYDLSEFKLSYEKLPKSYNGHDPYEFYYALSSRQNALKKGDYETTAEYNSRIIDLNNKPILAGYRNDTKFAFVVKPDKNIYSADTKKLTLGKMGYNVNINNRQSSDIAGVLIKNLAFEKSHYLGTNAYGVSIDVEKVDRQDLVLALKNPAGSKMKLVPFWIDNFKYEIPQVPPEKARAVRDNMRLVYIFTLAEPYFNEDASHTKPTYDKPEDSTRIFYNIHATVTEVWVFDYVTGEILLRVKSESVASD